ncbi:MAG: hypothetical protein CVV44_12435 [Spirochaetae bacterium HGW-Spirochaetae-1]|jgi:peptidoglycan/xylan/chitin deacetylase (PgdA/CDA1 family)|nr:MAG: hypothetical protein CVV44_12435 [Spirochaetae bacterium HGW-Spirochaetae-1]
MSGKSLQTSLSALLLILIMLPGSCAGKDDSFEKAMVSFRFDDAFASQVEACRLISSLNMKATIYCIAGRIDHAPYMTWADLQTLQESGHEIGSHSMTHPYLPCTGPGNHEYQVVQSKELLRQRGMAVRTFAYPYGLSNFLYDSHVRTNYMAAATYPLGFRGALNSRSTDPYRISCIESPEREKLEELISQAVKNRYWLVLCFHRIGPGQGKYITPPRRMEDTIRLVHRFTRQGLVDVVTISEGALRLKKK